MFVFLALLLAVAPDVLPVPADRSASELTFQTAVDAYRRGDFASAETMWRSLWDEPLDVDARATLAHNLGNAAFRQEDSLAAVAWFTSATRLRPRDAEAWANLEFARADAGVGPADSGDLTSTSRRLMESVTPAEAEWIACGGVLLLALALIVEALRGGLLWRRAAWSALLLALGSATPLLWSLSRAQSDPHMIVRSPSAQLRSEPREDLPPIGEVGAAEVVERIDELPGWTRIQRGGGARGWVRQSSVAPIARREG